MAAAARIRHWIAGSACCLIACAAIVGAVCAMIDHEGNRLRVYWEENGDLDFNVGASGPVVVTHLLTSDKRSAELPEHLLIIDSAGRRLSKEEFGRLRWIDYLGNPVPPPRTGTAIQAVYYRATAAKPELADSK